jgi:hypothetical protein
MSKSSYGQKARKALQLLMGFRDPNISDALEPFGMTEAVLQDGWNRLQKVTHLPRSTAPLLDPGLVLQIDTLENRWFPATRHVLQNRYAAIGSLLFDGVSQTSGREVVLSADLFTTRMEQMAAGEPPFDVDGPAAREALRERGLTGEVLAEMRGLVDRVQTFKRRAVRVPEPHERQAAVDHLWAWYREWAGLARVALTNRSHLRILGLAPKRRGATEEVDEFADTVEMPAVPALVAQAGAFHGAPQLPAPAPVATSPARAPSPQPATALACTPAPEYAPMPMAAE